MGLIRLAVAASTTAVHRHAGSRAFACPPGGADAPTARGNFRQNSEGYCDAKIQSHTPQLPVDEQSPARCAARLMTFAATMAGLRYAVPYRHISNTNREHRQSHSALIKISDVRHLAQAGFGTVTDMSPIKTQDWRTRAAM